MLYSRNSARKFRKRVAIGLMVTAVTLGGAVGAASAAERPGFHCGPIHYRHYVQHKGTTGQPTTSTTTKPVATTPTTVKSTTTTIAKPVTTTPTTAKPVTTTPTTAKPVATAAVGDINTIESALPSTSAALSLGAGTYTFSDFAHNNAGVDLGAHQIIGQGSAKTIVSMNANSSSKASMVPAQSTGSTNQLYLMRSMSQSNVVMSGFTLQGTTQGHLYNGLMVGKTTGAKISDVKVVAVPGNAAAPPGETFGINDYDGVNDVYNNIEVDGKGVGAAAFGTNGSTNITINGLYSHDNPYSMGITFWKTNGGTLNDFRSVNNHKAINFEQDTGTFTINRPSFTNSIEGFDISTFSNLGTITLNINDPVLASGQKINIKAYEGATAYGGLNLEKKTDIHVYVGGVDKTSTLVNFM